MKTLKAEIEGPEQTPYHTRYFQLKLVLSADFPSTPPRGYFLTKIYHPNVDPTTGAICVDTLKSGWTPSTTLGHVLTVIRCLLIVPFPESSLNDEAGRSFMDSYDEYARRARLLAGVHGLTGWSSGCVVGGGGGDGSRDSFLFFFGGGGKKCAARMRNEATHRGGDEVALFWRREKFWTLTLNMRKRGRMHLNIVVKLERMTHILPVARIWTHWGWCEANYYVLKFYSTKRKRKINGFPARWCRGSKFGGDGGMFATWASTLEDRLANH